MRHVFSCVDIWLGWHRLVFIPGVVPGEMFNTEQLAALNIDTSILPVVKGGMTSVNTNYSQSNQAGELELHQALTNTTLWMTICSSRKPKSIRGTTKVHHVLGNICVSYRGRCRFNYNQNE